MPHSCLLGGRVVLARLMSNPYSTPLTRVLRAYHSLSLTGTRPRCPRSKLHKQAHRLTATERARLAERYVDGATVYELGTEFCVNRKTVARHLRGAGVAMQRSGHMPTDAELDEMVRLYQTGLSLEAVGQRLGFAARTVERHLEAQGVERRDTHGRSRS